MKINIMKLNVYCIKRRILIAIIIQLTCIQFELFPQSIGSLEVPNGLVIYKLNFGLREKNKDVLLKKYGEFYIAVKFRGKEYFDPNERINKKFVECYYIYSIENNVKQTWGLVTDKYVYNKSYNIIYDYKVLKFDENILLGLSNDVINYPQSISFVAIENSNKKAYETETYVILEFDSDNETIIIRGKDF